MNQKQLAVNTKGWKIRTREGFVPFVGVSTMGVRQLYRVYFSDNTFIDATSKHVFFTKGGELVQIKDLTPGTVLIGVVDKTVISITPIIKEQTYDVVESQTHSYFTNGVLSHNCEFLSSDALLIDSLVLTQLTKPVEEADTVFAIKDVQFYEPVRTENTYLVGVDPATGSGEDFSVIEVYHFPSMKQVAEYRSNTMSQSHVYEVLKNLIKYIERMQATCYFSVENNGVGQGIIALFEADNEPPLMSEFVSEDGRDKKGMYTTAKTKMRACVNLKEMLERGRIQIRSNILLEELKTFVMRKGAYAAQLGSTDDCVSAVLIILRILEEISTYEQSAYDRLYSYEHNDWDVDDITVHEEYDENDLPLPFIM